MTQTLTPTRERSLPVTREKVLEYLNAFGLTAQLTPQESEQFINLAQEFQLNPFKREIHVVPYGEGSYRRLSIVVGYEVYIKRAERTGQLNGWKAWTEGEGSQLKAVVQIFRKDWEHPFTHEVYWTEAVQNKKDGSATSFWSRMPKFQLRKVAISQGFRLAFPDELGGLPYEGAELSLEIPEAGRPPEARPTSSDVPPASDLPDIPQPEPSQAPAAETSEASGQTHTVGSVTLELDTYLVRFSDRFTPSHMKWIKDQVKNAGTVEKAQAMLHYAMKVVKQTPRDSRYRRETTSRGRTQAERELNPLPIF